jgi:ribosomal protein S12 methylthiotransferase
MPVGAPTFAEALRAGAEIFLKSIEKMRRIVPDITLRTTFIVGFPGETEEAFESLLEFIERTRFERLGVFKYSQEYGSRAAKMPEQLSGRIKNQRFRRAMTVQQRIAREMAEEKVGRELRLLVDQPLVARTEADAPDVDARVILSRPAAVGEFIQRRITGSRGYDLLA